MMLNIHCHCCLVFTLGYPHCQGGIHRYLEAFPDGGAFDGDNVVFDARGAMSAPKAKGRTPGAASSPEAAEAAISEQQRGDKEKDEKGVGRKM